MEERKKRGRPLTFKLEDRQRLAELIRKYGAAPASKISEVPISVATLLKIAREFDIKLKTGKRPKRAA